MPRIQRESVVPYSCTQMFSLVNDVGRYPEFLPGCLSSEILQRSESSMRARLQVGKSAFRHAFTTQNRWQTDQRIEMHLAEGPFKSLTGSWLFTPTAQGCKVNLNIDVEFANMLASMALGGSFPRVVNSLSQAFLRRARDLYG